jgi:hypothetical protein
MVSGSGRADRNSTGADGSAPLDFTAAAGLAIALRDLLEAGATLIAENGPPGPVEQRLAGHLRRGVSDLAYVAESFPAWERANLQRGLDAYLAAHPPQAEWFSLSSPDRDYEDLATAISRPGRPL